MGRHPAAPWFPRPPPRGEGEGEGKGKKEGEGEEEEKEEEEGKEEGEEETKKAVFRCDLTNEGLYAIKKARRDGAAMEKKMNIHHQVAQVADILAQSSDYRLRMVAWQLRNRLEQRPPLSKQEALDLLRQAEREAALAAAWAAAVKPRR